MKEQREEVKRGKGEKGKECPSIGVPVYRSIGENTLHQSPITDHCFLNVESEI